MNLPPEYQYGMTIAIFTLTYLALAWGGIPGLRIDRAGIALAGAAAMLSFGVISFHEATESIDAETIALLLGMMIVVTTLQLSGFFHWLTEHVAARCSGPYSLLAVTIALSGILSALLVNDVVCVALTPLVLRLCQRLRRPPVPYLIGLATASNVGSVATITGNPQNIIIGSLSGISYLRFAERLAPVAIIGLVLNFVIVALVYRRQLNTQAVGLASPQFRFATHPRLMIKSVLITLGTIQLFFVAFRLPLSLWGLPDCVCWTESGRIRCIGTSIGLCS